MLLFGLSFVLYLLNVDASRHENPDCPRTERWNEIKSILQFTNQNASNPLSLIKAVLSRFDGRSEYRSLVKHRCLNNRTLPLERSLNEFIDNDHFINNKLQDKSLSIDNFDIVSFLSLAVSLHLERFVCHQILDTRNVYQMLPMLLREYNIEVFLKDVRRRYRLDRKASLQEQTLFNNHKFQCMNKQMIENELKRSERLTSHTKRNSEQIVSADNPSHEKRRTHFQGHIPSWLSDQDHILGQNIIPDHFRDRFPFGVGSLLARPGLQRAHTVASIIVLAVLKGVRIYENDVNCPAEYLDNIFKHYGHQGRYLRSSDITKIFSKIRTNGQLECKLGSRTHYWRSRWKHRDRRDTNLEQQLESEADLIYKNEHGHNSYHKNSHHTWHSSSNSQFSSHENSGLDGSSFHSHHSISHSNNQIHPNHQNSDSTITNVNTHTTNSMHSFTQNDGGIQTTKNHLASLENSQTKRPNHNHNEDGVDTHFNDDNNHQSSNGDFHTTKPSHNQGQESIHGNGHTQRPSHNQGHERAWSSHGSSSSHWSHSSRCRTKHVDDLRQPDYDVDTNFLNVSVILKPEELVKVSEAYQSHSRYYSDRDREHEHDDRDVEHGDRDLEHKDRERETYISKSQFIELCPAIVYSLLQEVPKNDTEQTQAKVPTPSSLETYGLGTVSVFVISLASLVGAVFVKLTKTVIKDYVMGMLLSLSVGCLIGDAVLHLIAEILEGDFEEVKEEKDNKVSGTLTKQCALLASIYGFFLLELTFSFLRTSQVHNTEEHIEQNDENELKSKRRKGKVSLVWMIIIGDAIHNFADGLAIGAAFSKDITVGLSTSIAVFCHELPHELGDFAALLSSGLTVKRAMFLNFISSLTAFGGLYIGIIASSNDVARSWIFAAGAGMFIYIALANLIPEVLEYFRQKPNMCMFLSLNFGLLLGYVSMLLLAIYESDIKLPG